MSATPLLAPLALADTPTVAGYVYAATNASAGNVIDVFARGTDGRLTQTATSYPTGGNGSGAPTGSGFEQSQNGLVLGGRPGAETTAHTNLLFAVNAGSNTVSDFLVDGASLTKVSTIATGATKPTSLTVHGDLLYVLDEGELPLGDGGVASPPSITGFTIASDGTLTAVARSTRALSGGSTAGGAQVSFDPSGAIVTVTERDAPSSATPPSPSGVIDSWTVRGDGTLSAAPSTTQSAGSNPFGFAESLAHPGTIYSAEGNFPTTPGGGAASAYSFDRATGAGTPVSSNIVNGQNDTCWVVFDNGERHVYTTSFFSNTVSSYTVGDNGSLTLDQAVAGVTEADSPAGAGLPSGAGANDEATSTDGHFLYARNFVDGSIAGFVINDDGTLTSLGTFGAVGPASGFGLAAGDVTTGTAPVAALPEAPYAVLLLVVAGTVGFGFFLRRRSVTA